MSIPFLKFFKKIQCFFYYYFSLPRLYGSILTKAYFCIILKKTNLSRKELYMKTKLFGGLSGNQLKMVALIAMTCDHAGLQLLPQYEIFRFIGRLAFPIFAFMIAEGAKYTKNRTKYFLQMFGLGVICQLVYFFAMGSLYQCILITFSFSVLLIYTLDHAMKKKNAEAWLLFALAFIATVFLVEALPHLLPETDYRVDYGIWGVLSPVLVFAAPKKLHKLLVLCVPLAFLALIGADYQWMAFFALIPLALYNGTRGKWRMKNIFYIYYPLHLVVIYGIDLLI